MDAAACADIVPAQDTLAAATDSADTTTIPIHDIVPAQEILQAIEDRMTKTAARLESHVLMTQTNIHRFPRGLRGIGGQDDRYIVPSVVAIGPYHHGLPHLQEMEEVKHAAANRFCGRSGRSAKEVYEKMLSVAGDARRCYAATDAAVALLSDPELAAMMFLDGCFLLEYMADSMAPLFLSCGLNILKDMMLLENQIPWLVLEALAEFMAVPVDVRGFVAAMGEKFFPKKENKGWLGRLKFQIFRMKPRRRSIPAHEDCSSSNSIIIYKADEPAHLLGLLRYSQIHSMPEQELDYQAGSSSSLSSSAVELAQMGVELTSSTASWFADVNVNKGPVFGELCLSPVFLSDVTACWLVNMVALEASTADGYGFVVSSYLSLLAMLMDREEDVHELRRRRVLHGLFSNTQTLAFFKGLGQHLRFGDRYFVILEQIDAYKRHRPVRIFVHKFVYNHYKTIAAIMSIAGVLVGIFKELRQH